MVAPTITRIYRWTGSGPAGGDEEQIVANVAAWFQQRWGWLLDGHLHLGDGDWFVEATITGRHQWDTHRRARKLALVLQRKLRQRLPNPEIVRPPVHPGRAALAATASRQRWGQRAGGHQPHGDQEAAEGSTTQVA